MLPLFRKEFLLIGRSLGGVISLLTLGISLIFIFYSAIEVQETLSVKTVRGLKWAIVFLLNFVIVSQSLWEERESSGWETSLENYGTTTLYLAKTLVVLVFYFSCECYPHLSSLRLFSKYACLKDFLENGFYCLWRLFRLSP